MCCLLFVTLPLAYYVYRHADALRDSGLSVPARELLSAIAEIGDVTREAVALHFLTRQDAKLGREIHWLPAVEVPNQRIAQALETLARGPDSRELAPVIPPGVKCRSVFIDEELRRVYLDLSPELLELNLSVLAEWAMIFGIINTTVGAAEGIETVHLLCNGEPIREWAGVWDLSGPLRPEATHIDVTERRARGR